jgi:hypothetical protein
MLQVEGQEPDCPSCGNANAMLERGPQTKLQSVCRDCGFTVDKGKRLILHFANYREAELAIEGGGIDTLYEEEEPKLGDISNAAWDAAAREMACAGEVMLDQRPDFSFGEWAGESDCEIVEAVTGLCFHELTNEQQAELIDIYLKGDGDQLLPMNPATKDDAIDFRPVFAAKAKRGTITKAALELGNLLSRWVENRHQAADCDEWALLAKAQAADTKNRTATERRRSADAVHYFDGQNYGIMKERELIEDLMAELGLTDTYQLAMRELSTTNANKPKPFTAGGTPTEHYDMSDQQAADIASEGRRGRRG